MSMSLEAESDVRFSMSDMGAVCVVVLSASASGRTQAGPGSVRTASSRREEYEEGSSKVREKLWGHLIRGEKDI